MPKKILVVTHCHTYGLANSLSFLLPQCEVAGMDQNLFETKAKGGDIPKDSFWNIVIVGPQALKKDGLMEILKYNKLVVVPGIQVDRYHPDICWIPHDGKLLWGPIGQNHSRIIFRAYQKGYSATKIRELFNMETYQKAGFLTYRNSQIDNLVARFREFDIDISKYLTKWSRNGSFMHTSNHPKIEVLFDISKEVVKKLALPSILDEYPDIGCCVEDNLAIGAVYPVYPEIATAYGFKGHYYFKKPHSYKLLSLDGFIEQSLNCYESAHEKAPLDNVKFYMPHYSDTALAEII